MTIAEPYMNLEEAEIDSGSKVNDTEVKEDSSLEEERSIERYNVSSYGWDMDVEGLVKNMKKGDIYAPCFQGTSVWSNAQKSRFIESIILELPTPNVFLAHDLATDRLNVVDGLQRLTALREYLSGKFPLDANDLRDDLKGKYYPAATTKHADASSILGYPDIEILESSVIRAIILRPMPPPDNPQQECEYNAAIIQMSTRLNDSGSPPSAQEIRASILYGKFNDLLGELNDDSNWRELFGKRHSRLRDVELVLRAIALIAEGENYQPPMSRFLDAHMGSSRDMESYYANEIRDYFGKIMEIMNKTLGREALRGGDAFLVSKLDALAVGLHQYLISHDRIDENEVKEMTAKLESNREFREAASGFINHTDKALTRIRLAKEIFSA